MKNLKKYILYLSKVVPRLRILGGKHLVADKGRAKIIKKTRALGGAKFKKSSSFWCTESKGRKYPCRFPLAVPMNPTALLSGMLYVRFNYRVNLVWSLVKLLSVVSCNRKMISPW